jgi:hypothetical protein
MNTIKINNGNKDHTDNKKFNTDSVNYLMHDYLIGMLQMRGGELQKPRKNS